MEINLSKVNRWMLIIFYVSAGLNHFRDPEFYYPLIPDYMPFPVQINLISGLSEIILGIGVGFSLTRRWSAFGVIIMLIAFVPSHIHFIAIGGCVSNSLCVPLWIGWLRLLLIHPLLIMWAWNNR